MKISWSDRIKNLPPYLFAEIDAKKDSLLAKGVDVIDLGVGDPDIPTPTRIINALHKSSLNPENHRYPSYAGMMSFRDEVASWYKKRFDVSLEGKKNVIAYNNNNHTYTFSELGMGFRVDCFRVLGVWFLV